MLEKTRKKLERANRPLWTGLYVRKTKTKRDKQNQINRKAKQNNYIERV